MIPPDGLASAGKCEADPNCLHVPCFQVQLEASLPGQAHRQSNACAYHVADVIQALRAWAGERSVVDGQLTILAIEPAAGGRQPGGSGGPDRSGLRGFAFSTIPLTSAQLGDPETAQLGDPETAQLRDAETAQLRDAETRVSSVAAPTERES
jgi:hypothetical protein